MPHWPHAPLHLLQNQGIYMVAAGTYLKRHFFQNENRLQLLHETLLSLSEEFGWELHASAVFSDVKSVYSFDASKVNVYEEF